MILVHPTLDQLLDQYREPLGLQFEAYRNHLYRLLNTINSVALLNDIELEKIAIAAVFHDLGLWTHHTLDYLDPSAQMATDYLNSINQEDWIDEVVAMIQDHHKIQVAKSASSAALMSLYSKSASAFQTLCASLTNIAYPLKKKLWWLAYLYWSFCLL